MVPPSSDPSFLVVNISRKQKSVLNDGHLTTAWVMNSCEVTVCIMMTDAGRMTVVMEMLTDSVHALRITHVTCRNAQVSRTLTSAAVFCRKPEREKRCESFYHEKNCWRYFPLFSLSILNRNFSPHCLTQRKLFCSVAHLSCDPINFNHPSSIRKLLALISWCISIVYGNSSPFIFLESSSFG